MIYMYYGYVTCELISYRSHRNFIHRGYTYTYTYADADDVIPPPLRNFILIESTSFVEFLFISLNASPTLISKPIQICIAHIFYITTIDLTKVDCLYQMHLNLSSRPFSLNAC